MAPARALSLVQLLKGDSMEGTSITLVDFAAAVALGLALGLLVAMGI